MTAKDKTYNGHKNWNHWNVSLWIGNDESLYKLAKYCMRVNRTRSKAAQAFLDTLSHEGITQTPDGAPYSVTTIRAAMRDL